MRSEDAMKTYIILQIFLQVIFHIALVLVWVLQKVLP